MLQETSKMGGKIPTTLARQSNAPPNHAPDRYKTLQNDSKMPWLFYESERLTDRTQMKNTHAQPFDVFTCQSPQNTRLCSADILSLLITTILQQSPVSFAHHHTCFCVVVMRTRQRRSHTNAFFNVIHLSVKNESTVVFYIDENVSKMNNNGHIASKTRKNFLPKTHDAYKML